MISIRVTVTVTVTVTVNAKSHKTEIERIQLILTDNDPSSHGALAHVKILDKCWEGVVHMLCVFHSFIMAFYKTVWLKLPYKRGNPYELTNKGKAYCTSLCSIRPIFYPAI